MSTAREARRKSTPRTSRKETSRDLTVADLDQSRKAVVRTLVEDIKIDGVPVAIYYTRLGLDEVRDEFSSIDELEGEEKLERTVDLVERHLVDKEGNQLYPREKLETLPIDWVNSIGRAIIRGASIEDEKNV